MPKTLDTVAAILEAIVVRLKREPTLVLPFLVGWLLLELLNPPAFLFYELQGGLISQSFHWAISLGTSTYFGIAITTFIENLIVVLTAAMTISMLMTAPGSHISLLESLKDVTATQTKRMIGITALWTAAGLLSILGGFVSNLQDTLLAVLVTILLPTLLSKGGVVRAVEKGVLLIRREVLALLIGLGLLRLALIVVMAITIAYTADIQNYGSIIARVLLTVCLAIIGALEMYGEQAFVIGLYRRQRIL